MDCGANDYLAKPLDFGELKEKILSNMSSRAAATLREDLESKGPVKLSEVEGAQKEILGIARRLADEGTISLGGSGEQML